MSMSMECQVNVKSQSELDIGGRETYYVLCMYVFCPHSGPKRETAPKSAAFFFTFDFEPWVNILRNAPGGGGCKISFFGQNSAR